MYLISFIDAENNWVYERGLSPKDRKNIIYRLFYPPMMKSRNIVIAIIIAIIVVAAGVTAFVVSSNSHPKTNLSTLYITTVSPVPSIQSEQLSLITSDFNKIGIPASYNAVGIPVVLGWLTANTTPNMVVNPGPTPPWPDPVFTQIIGATDVAYGFTYVDDSWLNNSTMQSFYPNIMFDNNTTNQINEVKEIYQVVYNNAPYIWLPIPDNTFFVQPYVNNFSYNPANVYYYNVMSYNSSYTAVKPPSNSTLTDAIQINAPDSLDPASAGLLEDSTFLNSVFQGLVEPSATNSSQVELVLANNYSERNYQNFTFNLRTNLHFSNNLPLNATDVWFSIYRSILMDQPAESGVNSFVLINSSQFSSTSYAIPWGFQSALLHYSNETHYVEGSNLTLNAQNAANYLSHMLSNFNVSNKTQMNLMEYSNQAISINGSNPLQIHINLLDSYPFYVDALAAGTSNYVVYPAYIDSHGGVQPNAGNNFTNLNGAIGSGPYTFKTISSSLSTIALQKNANYWGNNLSNIPYVAQPAHIKYVVIDYTLTTADKISGFISNDVQLTQVAPTSIKSIAQASPYNQLALGSYFKNEGSSPAQWAISMNAQVFPTDLTDFRLALVHAVNYTSLDNLFSYNGTTLATNYLGPVTPNFNGYYNPGNLPLYQFNITLAEHYLNLAGLQGHFYVTLPNGTVLGDKAMISDTISGQFILTVFTLESQLETSVATKF